MKILIFFNALFGFFTIVAFFCSLLFVFLIFTRHKRKTSEEMKSYSLYFASSVAIFSTIGSLIYSEIIGFIPCDFCWYQRYIMYPLSIFLIYVSITKSFVRVATLISGSGALISLRHIYFQNGGGQKSSCSVDVPCSLKYVEIFNFISIPLMALTAFMTIFLSLLYYELSNKVENE